MKRGFYDTLVIIRFEGFLYSRVMQCSFYTFFYNENTKLPQTQTIILTEQFCPELI